LLEPRRSRPFAAASGIATALLTTWLVACAASSEAPRDAIVEDTASSLLAEGNWFPENRAFLERWLREVSRREIESRPIAAFDWDNTSVFNDASEQLFHYQLDRLALKLAPEQLAELLPAEINGLTRTASGLSLADLREDALAAYSTLWPDIERGAVEQARARPEHRDFRARMVQFYEETLNTEGIGADRAFPWLVRLFAGYTPEEVRVLTRAALAERLTCETRIEQWRTETDGRCGPYRREVGRGLCAHPEMQDLMRALNAAGVEVFVISAGAEWVVEAAAEVMGYPLDPDHVFGMRVVQGAEGRLTSEVPPYERYPVTYRRGKAELVTRVLQRPALLVAGDAMTDYELLTALPETEISLVINRNKGGAMPALYRQALQPAAGQRRVLLQGRDENRSRFRKARETVPLGADAPVPLPGAAESSD